MEKFCPSNEFKQGKSRGKCWGCGHYRCKECQHYREDFLRLGQDYIDFVHQPRIKIMTII